MISFKNVNDRNKFFDCMSNEPKTLSGGVSTTLDKFIEFCNNNDIAYGSRTNDECGNLVIKTSDGDLYLGKDDSIILANGKYEYLLEDNSNIGFEVLAAYSELTQKYDAICIGNPVIVR